MTIWSMTISNAGGGMKAFRQKSICARSEIRYASCTKSATSCRVNPSLREIWFEAENPSKLPNGLRPLPFANGTGFRRGLFLSAKTISCQVPYCRSQPRGPIRCLLGCGQFKESNDPRKRLRSPTKRSPASPICSRRPGYSVFSPRRLDCKSR